MNRLTKFVRRLYGEQSDYDRIVNSKIACAASAEDMVIAGFIQRIAKDFAGCEYSEGDYQQAQGSYDYRKDTIVVGKYVLKKTYYKHPYNNKCSDFEFFLNDKSCGERVYTEVLAAYLKMQAKVQAAEQAAAEAKARMEQNEFLWNVAEDMLGLKRNEYGALVPKVSV